MANVIARLWMARFSGIIWTISEMNPATLRVEEQVGQWDDILSFDPLHPLSYPRPDTLLRDIRIREFHVPADTLRAGLTKLLSANPKAFTESDAVVLDGLSFGFDAGRETVCVTWHELSLGGEDARAAFDETRRILNTYGATEDWDCA
jgi:hypothetical protein